LNALLIGLGSSLRIVPETLDAAFVTTSGSHILANPLTAGVATFTYAATARVSGGIPLFTVLGGQTFIAEEGIATAISEPSTMALLGAGLSLLGMLRRRSRKIAASRYAGMVPTGVVTIAPCRAKINVSYSEVNPLTQGQNLADKHRKLMSAPIA
jgi:hypothetical protein